MGVAVGVGLGVRVAKVASSICNLASASRRSSRVLSIYSRIASCSGSINTNTCSWASED